MVVTRKDFQFQLYSRFQILTNPNHEPIEWSLAPLIAKDDDWDKYFAHINFVVDEDGTEALESSSPLHHICRHRIRLNGHGRLILSELVTKNGSCPVGGDRFTGNPIPYEVLLVRK